MPLMPTKAFGPVRAGGPSRSSCQGLARRLCPATVSASILTASLHADGAARPKRRSPKGGAISEEVSPTARPFDGGSAPTRGKELVEGPTSIDEGPPHERPEVSPFEGPAGVKTFKSRPPHF